MHQHQQQRRGHAGQRPLPAGRLTHLGAMVQHDALLAQPWKDGGTVEDARMAASTSSRYRIVMRPRTSDCSAEAARNSRPDIGTTCAHTLATVTHEGTISPVVESWVI